MSSAKITMIGFENFLSAQNESLFDYMTLPSGIDKDTLVGSILMRAGEFEVLYSDPYLLRDMIGLWSRKNQWTFDKWIKAINVQYDPLNNYDRTEVITDTHNGSKQGGSNGSNTSNNTRTDDLKTENDATTTDQVSAENVSSFSDANKSVLDQETKNTGTVKDNGGGTFNETHNDTDNYTDQHNAHIFGNIGVTTSQQMLQSELDIARFNIYEAIADLFITEFCILVY